MRNFQDIPDELLGQLYSFMQIKQKHQRDKIYIHHPRIIIYTNHIRDISELLICPLKKSMKNNYNFTKEHEPFTDELFEFCETFYEIENDKDHTETQINFYNDD